MSAPEPVLEALAAGCSVIPCSIDKHAIGKWRHWQDRRPDRGQLEVWARNPKVACWAIVTGAISDRVVIDFDGAEGKVLLDRFDLEPHGRTGRAGAHVHLEHPGWYVPTLNGKAKKELGRRWPGLDVKGDGGYAIFHGRTEFGEYDYRPIGEIELVGVDALPVELRRDIRMLEPTISASTILERYLAGAVAPQNGNEGNRNNLGFELACQLRDNAIERGEAEETMREFARRCPVGDYPLLEQDALASLAQAYSRPKRKNWSAPPNTPSLKSTEHTEHGAQSRSTSGLRVRKATEHEPNTSRTRALRRSPASPTSWPATTS